MYYIIAILISAMSATGSHKPTLIYIGDPMCSWCYGISEQLSETILKLEGKVETQLLVGGLRSGGGDEWNDEFKSFLKHHWEEVSVASNQPFSYDLLEKDDFHYDTEPSCRATVVCQSINIDKQFDFFKSIQKKFYVDNDDPKEVSFYKSICEIHDIDFNLFSERFESEIYKIGTQEHFAESRKMGVNSFPTIVLKHGGKLQVIAQGYATSEQMVARIESIINN